MRCLSDWTRRCARTSKSYYDQGFMKLESVVYAVSGVFFGLIVGWIIGSQLAQTAPRPRTTQSEPAPQAAAPAPETHTPAPAILDETKVQALQAVVARDPKNAAAQSPEGQQAKQALDSLSSAHGNIGQ